MNQHLVQTNYDTNKTKIESDFINLNKITNKLIQDSNF
jgi:hypothetical protein